MRRNLATNCQIRPALAVESYLGLRLQIRWLVGLWCGLWTISAGIASAADDTPADPAEAAEPAQAAEAKSYQRPVVIEFEGLIAPPLEQYLKRRLQAAKDYEADLIILKVDSPGGRLDVCLAIAKLLLDIDWAKTVVYIPDGANAYSAAAILSLAADEIVIHPASIFGDAGVIATDRQGAYRFVPQKLISAERQEIRKLAEAKGRSPALAEAMLNKDIDVYRVRNRDTGEEKYLIADQDGKLIVDKPGDWEKISLVEETGQDLFFTVKGSKALEYGIASATVEDNEQLYQHLGLKDDPYELPPYGTMDSLVYFLNLPLVTGILFVIGLICIYLELQMAGVGVFGLLAALCFTVFFWSRVLGGTADWLEIVLFVSGLVCILMELFVIPGFGIAGLAGALLVVTSIILAGQSSLIPKTDADYRSLMTTMIVLTGSGGTFAVSAFIISRHFGTLPLFNRIVLQPPETVAAVSEQVDQPGDDLASVVGKTGEAISALRPAGRIILDGDYHEVTTDGELVAAGTRVEVVRVDGSRLVVRPVDA